MSPVTGRGRRVGRLIAFLVIVVVVVLMVGWFIYARPPAEVRFQYRLENVEGLSGMDPLVFALVADIHVRQTRRAELVDIQAKEKILARFIDSMNSEVRPDFIVQLGDLVDSHAEVDTGLVSTDAKLGRIALARRLTRDNTDIPWFDVIGNHEYAGDNPARYPEVVAAIRGGSTRSWYFEDIKGYRCIFLDTSRPSGRPHTEPRHMVPEEEIEWLKGVLEETTGPAFVFMHVPVSAGDGTPYDQALNQERVSEVLEANPQVVASFFAHCHHGDAWDGLRKQTDRLGNVFFHVTAPDEWMGDSSQHPWVVVSVDPAERTINVEVGSEVVRSPFRQAAFYAAERASFTAARMARRTRNKIKNAIAPRGG
jgi:3',5'-cyclic AMP phosphodiesterase CpdA